MNIDKRASVILGKNQLSDKFALLKDHINDPQYVSKMFYEIFPSYIIKLAKVDVDLIAIFQDYMIKCLEFATLQSFNLKKSGTFMEICSFVFTESFALRLSAENSFNLFKKLIITHAIFRPPSNVNIFNLEDLKAITTYLQQTFYSHYLMYSYAFTPEVNLELETFDMIA